MNVDLAALYGIGVMTLATPCVLPLLPIYLGMLLGTGLEAAREPGGRLRLFTATVAFAAGFSLVFILLGLGASTLGSFLQNHRTGLTLVGAALIVVFGLKFLGLLRVPGLDRELRLPQLRTGRRLIDAGLFGVVFALGWTPCVGPLLGSVLTYTASRTADPLTGAFYLGVYSLGVSTPLLALSLFVDRLLPWLERIKRRLPLIEKITGGALVLIGLRLALTILPLPEFDSRTGEGATIAAPPGPGPSIDPPLGTPSARPRVIEFYRPGCSACEQARQTVEAFRSDCAGRRIEIFAVNTEDPRNHALTQQYTVAVVPTFVLLDTTGDEQDRLIGAPALDDLRSAAARLMAETCGGTDGIDRNDHSGDGAACPGDPTSDGQFPQQFPALIDRNENCTG